VQREFDACSDRRRWLALAVIVAAQFMVVLDVAIVNVALPSIKTDLNFSQESLQWVITAYANFFGGVLLLGGRLVDLLGRRRLFRPWSRDWELASCPHPSQIRHVPVPAGHYQQPRHNRRDNRAVLEGPGPGDAAGVLLAEQHPDTRRPGRRFRRRSVVDAGPVVRLQPPCAHEPADPESHPALSQGRFGVIPDGSRRAPEAKLSVLDLDPGATMRLSARSAILTLALTLTIGGTAACQGKIKCSGSPCQTTETTVVTDGAGGASIHGHRVMVSDITVNDAKVTVEGASKTLRRGEVLTIPGTTIDITLADSTPTEHQVKLSTQK
jgi:hypothetical protein